MAGIKTHELAKAALLENDERRVLKAQIAGNKKAARRLLFFASEAGLKPVFP
jgi:4'-phosphopantetheinyl transferase EntD